MSTKDNLTLAILVELRKPKLLRSDYKVRKWRKMKHAIDRGYRPPISEEPYFSGEEAVMIEHGKITGRRVMYARSG